MKVLIRAIATAVPLMASALRAAEPASQPTTQPAVIRFKLDSDAPGKPISPWIYGINAPINADWQGATFVRVGGNRWSAYNWVNNASNAGNDYHFQNDGFLSRSNTPGAAVLPALTNALDHRAALLLTIPTVGYVSADKAGDGDVRNVHGDASKPNANFLAERFKREAPAKGAPFTLTPAPDAPVVYQDEFVNWVLHQRPGGAADPNAPIFFSLDNEPDLWASTHAEVHPQKPTYAEMVEKAIAYAKAVKAVAPQTKIFGPVNYGWNGYVSLQNAPDSKDLGDFQSYYLRQMARAEQDAHRRLLDVFDVHWYPEARGGGIRVTERGDNPALRMARVQAPRSLWDPTYTEDSWIARSTRGPIALIPRLFAKIDKNYPGLPLAMSEYSYGGGSDISGAIAEADALGVFGKYGLFAANEWPLGRREPFTAGAIAMYRNVDGAGAGFGDISIAVDSPAPAQMSVYASRDSARANRIAIVVINKTNAPIEADIQSGQTGAGVMNEFILTADAARPKALGAIAIENLADFHYTAPALSISTLLAQSR